MILHNYAVRLSCALPFPHEFSSPFFRVHDDLYNHID